MRKDLRKSVGVVLLSMLMLVLNTHAIGQSTVAKTPDNNVMWYNSPASHWLEALPLGNGTLGAMVYGGITREKIQFNENSLVTGTADYVGFYQPFGNLYLDFDHKDAVDYKRSLSLDKAIHRISYVKDGVKFQREYFVSHPDKALVMMITANRKGAVSMSVSLQDNRPSNVVYGKDEVHFAGSLAENKMEYMAKLKVVNKGGTKLVQDSSVKINNADTVLLYLGATTSFLRNNTRNVFGVLPVAALNKSLDLVATKPYAVVRKKHVDDFGGLLRSLMGPKKIVPPPPSAILTATN